MADDWSARQLCDDGSCTGVVGPDGTCNICGKPSEGYVASAADADEADEAPDDDEDLPGDADEDAEDADDEGADEWDNRQLCADGSCTGVIGDDGTCTICGKAAA